MTTCLFIVREPRCYGILSWQLLILIGCSPYGLSMSPCLAKRQCRQKTEESLDGGSSLFILDVVVGKEQGCLRE